MFVYVACMLKMPISLVYKGVSSEIRVCCAGYVYSKFGLTIWKVKTIGITGQNHKDKGRKLPFFHRLPIRKRLCAYTQTIVCLYPIWNASKTSSPFDPCYPCSFYHCLKHIYTISQGFPCSRFLSAFSVLELHLYLFDLLRIHIFWMHILFVLCKNARFYVLNSEMD